MSLTISTGAKGSVTVNGSKHATKVIALFVTAAARHAFHPVSPLTSGMADEAVKKFGFNNDYVAYHLFNRQETSREIVRKIAFAASLALGKDTEHIPLNADYHKEHGLTINIWSSSTNKNDGKTRSHMKLNVPPGQETGDSCTVTLSWDVHPNHVECLNRPYRSILKALEELNKEARKEESPGGW